MSGRHFSLSNKYFLSAVLGIVRAAEDIDAVIIQ